MNETLVSILQWLVPSGGLGTVMIWLTNKTLRNLRTAKEVHDTYKLMYQDTQVTLTEIRDENRKLQKILSRLERAVNRAPACRHYDICPVADELQKHKGDILYAYGRLTQDERKTNHRARDNTHESDSPDDPDG